MKRLILFVVFSTFATTACAAEPLEYFPPDTRLVVGINLGQALGSALVKKSSDRLRPIFEDFGKALAALGAEPVQVNQVWLACGEDYPKGCVLVVQGKMDPAKVENRLQQLVREKKLAARSYREGD